jgi:MSHA biogenesis protein MshL
MHLVQSAKMTPMTAKNHPLGALMPTVRRGAGMSAAVTAAVLAGCAADRPMRTPDVSAAIKAEMASAKSPATGKPVPAAVSESLAEPATVAAATTEPRIDLLINNAQVRDVFLAIVADTRYSMLMHPDIKGTISVTLRGVTVKEALDAIRDVYGYDYKIEGRRITVFPPTLQTRVFTVNYPNSQRVGASDTRVSSGGSTGNGATGTTGTAGAGGTSGSGTQSQQQSSSVSTSSKTDFWGEMAAAVRTMLGNGEGRSVITSPHAGIIMVRAMPEELRQVEKFLKAAQVAVERQVMLEAKIISVELRDGYQSGVNWAAMGTSVDGAAAIGVLGAGTTNAVFPAGTNVVSDVVSVPSAAIGGGLFGLALAASQFQAVMGFLETQGDVQTLSSPRVATLNNQKAVLKVGTDELYVTNISGGTANSTSSTSSSGSTTMPTVTLTPFFSGISLDVTPQVDDGSTITLHIHPSVTTVTEKSKQIDLGTVGNYKLPLASSSVNETDTLVRIPDGAIVAIGGLMQMESARSASGMPGTTDSAFSWLFGNKSATGRKREVIVLIKPTIIRTQADWEAQTERARSSISDMDAARVRVIEMGTGKAVTETPAK